MSACRYSLPLTVREEDVNVYHVSHDRYFVFFQAARVGYLGMFDYHADTDVRQSLVIADAACTYKKELYQGDAIEVHCRISEITSKSFVMAYQLFKGTDLCALGTTTYLGFDYDAKKVVPFPARLVERIKAYEGLP